MWSDPRSGFEKWTFKINRGVGYRYCTAADRSRRFNNRCTVTSLKSHPLAVRTPALFSSSTICLCVSPLPNKAVTIPRRLSAKLLAFFIRFRLSAAISYRMIGQYDKAIEYLERATKQYPDFLFAHLNLSACYILAGREKEAYAEAKEVLRLNPKFSVDRFDKALQLRNQEEKKKFIGALKKAFSFPNNT